MGNYIDQTDVENRWGTSNVAAWSQLSNTSVTVDAARVLLGIAWAEAYIDDRMRDGPYAVPLAPSNAIVEDWAATLAGVWLYRSRRITDRATETAEAIEAAAQGVEQEMDLYLAGSRKAAWGKSHTGGAAPWVMV